MQSLRSFWEQKVLSDSQAVFRLMPEVGTSCIQGV